MTVILDAGALIAVERRDLQMHRILRRESASRRSAVTHGGIIGQVWRGGTGRQVPLARALQGVDVIALGSRLGRAAGLLLGEATSSDVVDAALIVIANPGDEVYTSDPSDLAHLAEVAHKRLRIFEV